VLAEADEDEEDDADGSDEDDEDSAEEVAVLDRVADAGTHEEVEGNVKSAEDVAGPSKSANSKSSFLGSGNTMSVV
jgi:hypothetical protein